MFESENLFSNPDEKGRSEFHEYRCRVTNFPGLKFFHKGDRVVLFSRLRLDSYGSFLNSNTYASKEDQKAKLE